jgi:hypothetical protein
MGINTSADVKTLVTENVSKSTAQLLQNMAQTNEGTVDINQKCFIEIMKGATLSCVNLNISQTGAVSMSAINNATQDQVATMTQLVAQAVESNFKTAVAQENQKLNLLQSNLSATILTEIQRTQQDQMIQMEQTLKQTITQNSQIAQAISLIVGSDAQVLITGNCDFTQAASVDYTAQQIAKSAITVVTNQTAVQNASAQWDTAVNQKNTGIDPTIIIVVIIVVIVFIIVIAVGAYYGDKALKKKYGDQWTGGKKPAPKPKAPAQART